MNLIIIFGEKINKHDMPSHDTSEMFLLTPSKKRIEFSEYATEKHIISMVVDGEKGLLSRTKKRRVA